MLAGVRVLDLSHMMQGPWATEMLADMGADVIKVEHATHGERGRESGSIRLGGHSAMYLAMNRNKRSIGVDLKTDAGRRLLWQLIETADVLVQNFRPGTLARLGFGWDAVHATNPALIYCSGSGYGADEVNLPGQDLLAQARSGTMHLTGADGSPPAPNGVFLADAHAATVLASGICAALFERTRTGRGRHLEVDLIGSMVHQMTQELVAHHNADGTPERSPAPGNPFMEAPYGVYPTADGDVAVSICPISQLAAALAAPALAGRFTDQDAVTRRAEVSSAVADLLAPLHTDEALRLLQAGEVWCAPVNDFDAMATDPAVGWHRRHSRVHHPGIGELVLVHHPLSVDGQQLPIHRPAPRLGEHTAEVLAELGYPAADQAELARTGTVAAAPIPEHEGGHR
ncbi:CaiB/BaiF CoA transferase family protein [Ruania zhangjianzhongii]|uniref:CaiB/BaiF CoA transferase family protein n=1 Tax=Ruania zhangjianzhongii TaxID=2603206 RepID=UPI00143DFA79|nr:CaiB/BaiF CoA-transferase family protein [Ruania zhangjianzhongii]